MRRSRVLRAIALLVPVLLIPVALVVSSAATLPLHAGTIDTVTASAPCSGPIAVTATSATQVRLTGVDAACAGRTARLVVLSGSTAAVTTTTTLVTPTTTVTVATFNPTPAMTTQMTVDGWYVASTWTYAPGGPVGPTTSDTVLTSISWDLMTNNPVQACFTATVTTASSTPVIWGLTLDLAKPPFNGTSGSGFQLTGAGSGRFRLAQDSPSTGYLQVIGNSGQAKISSGDSLEITLCHWGLPAAVRTPSAYSVTTAPSTQPAQWSDTKACMITTVTGNGSEQFYFAWTTLVDAAPAAARLAQAGNTTPSWTYDWDQEWKLTRTQTGPSAFTVVSGTSGAIAGTETFTFTTCAVAW